MIERVTKIEEFKKRIKKRAEESPKGKIIIFIDDLDRIPEEKIVDFLDSLKIFLDISGCIFVLGCDYEILKNALRKKHGEEEIYKDYFDKIVQTEFYIPKISELAIRNYSQFLTGWSEDDIKKCTQLVIHSIGGNPRKIKRVVNATMLIKSVLERRSATFLQAFERPKLRTKIKGGEVKKEKLEVPRTSESKSIRLFITPTELFDFLFKKEMLFKLMCMREQWFTYYEKILIDEEKQQDLISLQDPDITTGISELHNTSKEQEDKLKENVENLPIFINDSPTFQGVMDLETYLTFMEISSPEAGIALKWGNPEKLPLNLFNRYMLFKRINEGEVKVKDIENRINQRDWESDLKSYFFFIEVISLLGYDNLLRDLLFKDEEKLKQIAEKIRDSEDLSTIGRLLGSVWGVDEGTARNLFYKETKEKYAEKIKGTRTDPLGIGRLLYSVNLIDEKMAMDLLKETEEKYAEKIKRTSTDPLGIGMLLYSVNLIDKNKAVALLEKTSEKYAEKIKAGKIKTDPDPLIACTLLLDVVREIDEKTAKELLNKTKDSFAEKIRGSTDLVAIGGLLDSVRKIKEETARELLNETKGTYAEKIRASSDLWVIGGLLDSVRKIDKETARSILNGTKGPVAEKIIASSDLVAIGWLLIAVIKIDVDIAKELLDKTKDSIAKEIRESNDLRAIGVLLDIVSLIEEETAKELLNETWETYTKKIIASSDLYSIEKLLFAVREIKEETARELLSQTKETIAEKIIASTDLRAVETLLDSVREIEEETAEWLEKKTKFKSEEK